MPVNDLSEFHRWLYAERTPSPGAIVLHGTPRLPIGLVARLEQHLNEFDEDARGLWQGFAPELVLELSGASNERRLLGLPDACDHDGCGTARACSKVCCALARRGFAVLEGVQAIDACADLEPVFRVSLGAGEQDVFHLCLKPEWFNLRALPAIIGDTYLEWRATRAPARAV